MNSKSKWCPIRVKQSLVYETEIHSLQVFVGGLVAEVDESILRSHFEALFGSLISVKVLRFPDGRSRGFGFVRFAKSEDYQRALEVKQTMLLGGEIECRPSVTRDMAQDDGKQLLKSKIILFGLDQSVSEKDIQEYFNMYGEIVRVKKFQCAEDRYPKHIYQGYVQFKTENTIQSLLPNRSTPILLEFQSTAILVYSATASCQQAKTFKVQYLEQATKKSFCLKHLLSRCTMLLDQGPIARTNVSFLQNPSTLGQEKLLSKTISSSTQEISNSHEDEQIRFNIGHFVGSPQTYFFFTKDAKKNFLNSKTNLNLKPTNIMAVGNL
jgi:RNA recognition motif-containing protein